MNMQDSSPTVYERRGLHILVIYQLSIYCDISKYYSLRQEKSKEKITKSKTKTKTNELLTASLLRRVAPIEEIETSSPLSLSRVIFFV
jgi:hypothetical protein